MSTIWLARRSETCETGRVVSLGSRRCLVVRRRFRRREVVDASSRCRDSEPAKSRRYGQYYCEEVTESVIANVQLRDTLSQNFTLTYGASRRLDRKPHIQSIPCDLIVLRLRFHTCHGCRYAIPLGSSLDSEGFH